MLNNIEDPLVMRLSFSNKRLLDITLRFILMVFTFAGTMYNLEILGDLAWLKDQYVYNGDTPLSFFQVCFASPFLRSAVLYCMERTDSTTTQRHQQELSAPPRHSERSAGPGPAVKRPLMMILPHWVSSALCFWDVDELSSATDEVVLRGTQLQMCYYTLVTISTVGYGDFAPVSVLGRVFAVVIIAGGVAIL
jgi:hypothetical protein